jgi:N-acetyltransferase 10
VVLLYIADSQNATLASDSIGVRDVNKMPPLLQRLSERKPENLDYLGVSFGLTKDLLRFWKKMGFVPLYASQKENALTGEYSFVMLKQLASAIVREEGWLGAFASGMSLRELTWYPAYKLDFRQRFMSLLSYPSFAKFDSSTALSILSTSPSGSASTAITESITPDELNILLSPFDMKRLETYTSGMIDYHVILDLVPVLSHLFFSRRLSDCTLSAVQQAVLLALGLQRKPVETLEAELGLTSSQTLALFGKIMRRVVKHIEDVRREGAGREIPVEQPGFESGGVHDVAGGTAKKFEALDETVEEELKGDAKAVSQEMRTHKGVQRELLDSVDMRQ